MSPVEVDGDWLAGDPTRPPALTDGDVHAWWFQGGATSATTRRDYLDGLLRRVLGGYVGTTPDSLRLDREPRGRPYLSDEAGNRIGPDFNLSDSAGHSLVVVSGTARVGVDIERRDRSLPNHRLAVRYFHPQEAAALALLDDEVAREHFIALWTAKEAGCKATGNGLSGQLDQWQFEVDAGTPRLLALPVDAGSIDDWQFIRLHPPGGFTAAVAARGELRRLRLFSGC